MTNEERQQKRDEIFDDARRRGGQANVSQGVESVLIDRVLDLEEQLSKAASDTSK